MSEKCQPAENRNMDSHGDPTNKENEEVASYGNISTLSVQEMVRRDPTCIPRRYVRTEEDRTRDVDMSARSAEVPILDLALLSDGHKEELKKLDMACKDWGFFQVINHGVGEEVSQCMKDSAYKFFGLPIEEKTKYRADPALKQGYGQIFPTSEEQTMDWSDALVLTLHPAQFRKVEVWPTTPPEFKADVEAFSAEVRNVAERLLASLSLIMGMDKHVLLDLHKDMMQSIRVNYYPTCCRPNQVMGLSPHSDATSITILMQDEDVTGLQIRHEGVWVPVKPIPNSLVVNIGDFIEIWSNGKYKSIDHRAVTSETRTRVSYGTFFFPHFDVEVEPLEQMLDAQQPHRKYKKVQCKDYLMHASQKKLEGKAHIEFAKYNV